MKIDYKHAKKLCSDNEFSLLEQCKPKTLVSFSEGELKRKLQQARKLARKWRDQARSQGGASRSEEKETLFSEAAERLGKRLARVEGESKNSGSKPRGNPKAKEKPRGFPTTRENLGGEPPLSLKKQANQKAILSSQRIKASGLDSRIRGHVSARGRRSEAARQSRNG